MGAVRSVKGDLFRSPFILHIIASNCLYVYFITLDEIFANNEVYERNTYIIRIIFIYYSMKLKKLSKGHYEYRGYLINCIGYYPPEKRIVWECVDEDGCGFGHDYTLKGCMFWVDEEINRNSTK